MRRAVIVAALAAFLTGCGTDTTFERRADGTCVQSQDRKVLGITVSERSFAAACPDVLDD